jgi:pyrroline-5-carboxylate reductase
MVCIIGGGKLGSAIAEGLLNDDPSRDVVITVRRGADTSALQARLPTARVVDEVDPSDGVIICVKPKDVPEAARAAAAAGAKRVLSVAAGVTLKTLKEACGADVTVIRSMPNVGAQVQHSATGYCAGEEVPVADLAWAQSILQSLGVVVRVDESQMDAVTGVSGSGIAFVLLALEGMIDGGIAAGLSPAESHELAVATLAGAAKVASGDESPADIRARVTTPNGTTAAGMAVLEARLVRQTFVEAVRVAALRSAKLGRS